HDVEQLLDHVLILSQRSLLLNATVSDLTERYSFEYRPVSDGSAVIYADPSQQGNAVIAERREDEPETPLNLELLFNYITSKKEA
ncbi:MAG: ABC transporter ATP-binding protein, partial [Prevotella sp.]|nr:ABC transporter ATP-binding protein [Prevotella sp.]